MSPEEAEIRERSKVEWRGWFTQCREDNHYLLGVIDDLREKLQACYDAGVEDDKLTDEMRVEIDEQRELLQDAFRELRECHEAGLAVTKENADLWAMSRNPSWLRAKLRHAHAEQQGGTP